MHPRLNQLRGPQEAYWVRNLVDWAIGDDEAPEVVVVEVSLVSLRRPHARCIVKGQFVHYVPFSELASTPARLRALLAKWEAVRVPAEKEAAA